MRASRATTIEAPKGFESLGIQELVAYHDLIRYLVWRDIKVRYAQTVLGATWAILQPLLTTVVFAGVFGRLAHVPTDGTSSYALFSMVAIVPWTYFATALVGASNSLVNNSNLLSKVYFPRLALPIAGALAALVDFAIALAVAGGILLVHGTPIRVGLLPLLLLLTALMTATAIGVGSWLAALSLRYRDVKHATPFFVQLWMFASPVIYPLSLVPMRYRWAYSLNPMAGVIDGFRSALLGTSELHTPAIVASFVGAAACMLAGTAYFRSVESDFADIS